MEEKAVYIDKLYLFNYKCFKDYYILDFTTNQEKDVNQWNVILGNNNSGKTNLLKAIAELEPHSIFHNGRHFCSPSHMAKGYLTFENKNTFIGCTFLFKEKARSEENLKGPFNYYRGGRLSDQERSPISFQDHSRWSISSDFIAGGEHELMKYLKIYSYGVSRKPGNEGISNNTNRIDTSNLLDPTLPLLNLEDWLLQLDYASKNQNYSSKLILKKLKDLFKTGIFPNISDFRCITKEDFGNIVQFSNGDGWRELKDLGYGYQTTFAWIFDLCKKMFDRYPDSTNPLKEPAVVLIDELDLHLHPSWQKNIIKLLTQIFSATQFIVTTHSAFIIQSIDNINLFIINTNNKNVEIRKSDKTSFKGWSTEEILEEIMEMENPTVSDEYSELIDEFNDALDREDKQKAKRIFKKISEVIHPENTDKRIFEIQLKQLLND